MPDQVCGTVGYSRTLESLKTAYYTHYASAGIVKIQQKCATLNIESKF